MEWTDTLMLDSSRNDGRSDSQRSLLAARVMTKQGITFLHADAPTYAETTASLELLRGFRESVRRVVLCEGSWIAAGRQLGHEVVELGLADVLVSCGRTGREVGIGARDAGLDLSSVVVCNTADAGCRVLTRMLHEGDTVLLLGIEQEECDGLIESLGHCSTVKSGAAA